MPSTDPPAQSRPAASPENKMTLYARAAASLYGVISLDDFFKVLEVYYGKGALSRKKVSSFFRQAKGADPIYYVQDGRIVHSSISPDQAVWAFGEIQHSADPRTHGQRRILPEKEFLMYADPSFYEETRGTKEMEAYLADEVGLSREDVREIVTEMVFICRSGACPTYVMDALKRRGISYGRDCELYLITYGCAIEGEARLWERLGFTGGELQAQTS